ncbi:MAG: hypothetical protein JXQ68_06205 [Campylobacterales bacterium]|nr:hypothetical protein [Campylobacterales bacterium]
MFVGWHNENFERAVEDFDSSILCDTNLLIKTWQQDKSHSFGAYKDGELFGMVSAFRFDKAVLINNFCYKQELSSDDKKRLLSLLLKNINESDKSILVLVSNEERELFDAFEFKSFAPFHKALYDGHDVGLFSTNFSNISSTEYMEPLRMTDKEAYRDDRFFYITHMMMKSSSLVLSTPNGYQHSYALNKSTIKISPWVMRSSAFEDAQKLLRALIHHRGLKKIIAFIPAKVKEITDLYSAHGFKYAQNYNLMYLNEKPDINLEMIYGF